MNLKALKLGVYGVKAVWGLDWSQFMDSHFILRLPTNWDRPVGSIHREKNSLSP